MFGSNVRHGKSTFKDLADNELKVSSIFYTLQGEGPHSGRPAVFVRLTHCSLSCSWCDSYFEQGEILTFQEVYQKTYRTIETFFGSDSIPHWAKDNADQRIVLVVTGGEPLLQQRNLAKFLWHVEDTFPVQQIETNGILPIVDPFPSGCMIVCSPKCVENDHGQALHYIRPSQSILKEATCLKFVVTADKESPYHTVPEFALAWREETEREIYVSPMNMYLQEPQQALLAQKTNPNLSLEERSEVLERISFWEDGLLDKEKNQANHEWAARLCLEHGFRLSLQTHLFASLP